MVPLRAVTRAAALQWANCSPGLSGKKTEKTIYAFVG